MLKIWLKQIRANFLPLAVVLVLIGGAAAHNDDAFKPFLFALTMIGVVLAHISVNLFNEYSDWKTGIDDNTKRTPFSGGTGTIQAQELEPSQVKKASWGTLIAAFIIGLYLTWQSGWPVLVFMVAGGLATVLYTDFLAKIMLGEFASGLTLGSFVVLGTYFVQTGELNAGIIWASIPPGLLTIGLLYLNEFPDIEADTQGGRHHLIIALGRKRASVGYVLILAAVYGTLAYSAMTGIIPLTALAGLLTLPIACVAGVKALKYPDDMERLLPALGMNVVVVLVTDVLMAVGFVLA